MARRDAFLRRSVSSRYFYDAICPFAPAGRFAAVLRAGYYAAVADVHNHATIDAMR